MTQQAILIATIFNVFVNPIALGAIGWKYYLVFVAMLVVILITVYRFYPETKGFSLEEVAVIFDGERARVISEGAVTTNDTGGVAYDEHVQGPLELGHLKSLM